MFLIVNYDIFLIRARQCLISRLYIQRKSRVTCQSLCKKHALRFFLFFFQFDDMCALTNPSWTNSFLLIRYKVARRISFPKGKVISQKRPKFFTVLRSSLWVLFQKEGSTAFVSMLVSCSLYLLYCNFSTLTFLNSIFCMIAYFSDFSQFEIKDVSSKMESTWSNNPKFWLEKKIYIYMYRCIYIHM